MAPEVVVVPSRPEGSLRCPHCVAGYLDPRDFDEDLRCECPDCGASTYCGYVAESVQVGRQIDYLSARRSWLDDLIARQSGPPPAPLLDEFQVWAPPFESRMVTKAPAATRAGGTRPLGVPPAERPARTRPSLQTTLLGLGGLLLAIAALAFSAIMWERLGAWGQAALLVGVALAAAIVGTRLHTRARLRSTGATLIAVGYLMAACDLLVAAPASGLVPSGWMDASHAYPAIVCSVLAIAAIVLGAWLANSAWVWSGWLTVPVASGLWTAFVLLALPDPSARLWPVVSGVVALGGVGLWALSSRDGARWVGQRNASRAAAVGVWAVALVGLVTLVDADAWWTWLAILVLAAVVSGAGYAIRRDNVTGTALALVAPLALAWVLSPPGLGATQAAWVAAAVGVLGAGLALQTAVVAVPPGVSAVVLWFAWLARCVVCVTALSDVGDSLTTVSMVLAAEVAVTAFVYSLLRGPLLLAWPAALVGIAALLMFLMTYLPLEGSEQLERATVPAAVLLAVAGLIWSRHRGVAPEGSAEPPPRPSTRSTMLPALATLVIPSALLTWEAASAGDGLMPASPVRLVVTTVVAAVLLIVGARAANAALVITGAAALMIIALGQLVIFGSHLPQWAVFGLVGAALVGAGARVEWLRGQGRQWAARLRELG